MSNASSSPAVQGSGPVKVSPPLAVTLVLAIYFGSIILGQIILSMLPLLAGWPEGHTEWWFTSSVAGQFAFVAIIELITLALLYAVMQPLRLRARDIGLIRPRLRDLGVAMLAYPPYFVLNAISSLAANAWLRVDLDQPQQTGFEQAAGGDLVLTFISLVILPPIVEEIVMRGFLFSNLKRAMKVVPAAVLTSIIFSVAHLQFGSGAPLLWAAAIDTFVLSLVLCYVRHKTGSLWPCIWLHAFKNGLAFFVLFIYPMTQ